MLVEERFLSHFLTMAEASVASVRLIRLVPFVWPGVLSPAPPYGQLGLDLSTLREVSSYGCNLCMEGPASGSILGASAISLYRTLDGSLVTVTVNLWYHFWLMDFALHSLFAKSGGPVEC